MATPCCRPAALAAARSIVSRSKTLIPKTTTTMPAAAATNSRRASPLVFRSIALASSGSVESLRPLHSAIASARLKSFIAVDSSCWSWLSQDFAVPQRG